ncbi:peptidoglycan-binding protein [Streptomyces sp. NPDC127110]|uniref:peptidoglycan-binding protein n=1 Tax=Streptomyces sp. NPDC127110 TaxID=3345362 RepID=UPI00362F8557
MQIISRAQWGAQPWSGTPNSVSLSRRTEFFVHHDGEDPILRTGYAIMRAIEAVHLGQNWAGVGYNFVVAQDGTVYEGRGWGLQGAHCPDHNVSGIGVQIAIGGDQTPSPEALAACRALYEEACARTGRTLAMKGHKDGFPTECPGTQLYAWVQAGMPAGDYKPAPDPGGTPVPGSDDMARYRVTINGLSYGYGSRGEHVTQVGEALVAKGFGRHYTSGPGPVWTDADTANYADYQLSLGHTGDDADGVPGESSLRALLGTLPGPGSAGPPPYPGREAFGPGKSNQHIQLLGEQLVRHGFGQHYTTGPSPEWGEADRRNTAAFQRSLAELAGDADGYPGPLTWQLLFS